MLSKIKSFLSECVRVFTVTRKPGMEEFKTIVKVSSLGILIIGFIGFIVHIIWTLST